MQCLSPRTLAAHITMQLPLGTGAPSAPPPPPSLKRAGAAVDTPPLLVRRARVEDYDDLAALGLSRDALAQLLDVDDDATVTLAAEGPDGRAVGCAMLTGALDTDALGACFQLRGGGAASGLRGLRKRTAADVAAALATARAQRAVREDALALLAARREAVRALLAVVAEGASDCGGDGGDADDVSSDAEPPLLPLSVAAVALNASGDAWGYAGAGGARLGDVAAALLRHHLVGGDGAVLTLDDGDDVDVAVSAAAFVDAVDAAVDERCRVAAAAAAPDEGAVPRVVAVTSDTGASDDRVAEAAARLLNLPVLRLAPPPSPHHPHRLGGSGGGSQAQALLGNLRKPAFAHGAVVTGLLPQLSPRVAAEDDGGGGDTHTVFCELAQAVQSPLSLPVLLLHGWDGAAPPGLASAVVADDGDGGGVAHTFSRLRGRNPATAPQVCLVEVQPARLRARRAAVAAAADIPVSAAVASSASAAAGGDVGDELENAVRGALQAHGLLPVTDAAATPASASGADAPAAAGADAGDSDAFGVLLFAVDPRYAGRASNLLLAGAFAAFPDRRFAVYAQPCAHPRPTFLDRFVHVPPAHPSRHAHSLYVCAREALALPGALEVRRAGAGDSAGVRALLERQLAAQQLLVDSVMDAVVAAEAQLDLPLPADVGAAGVGARAASVATSGCVVGLLDGRVVAHACFGNVDGGAGGGAGSARAALATAFELPPLPTGPVVSLAHAAVEPVYAAQSRHFLERAAAVFAEGADGAAPAVLYRRGSSWLPAPVAEAMTLLPPKRLPAATARSTAVAPADGGGGADDAALAGDAHCPYRLRAQPTYALAAASEGVCAADVGARIVVVGASSTGLAALTQLLCAATTAAAVRPRCVTLVDASAAWEGGGDPSNAGDGGAAVQWHSVLPHLTAAIKGRVVGIDRQRRVVALADGAALPCDALVLTPGLQEASWRRAALPSSNVLPPGMHALPPCGRAAADALAADIAAVASASADPEAPVVDVLVYGASLTALGAVQRVLAAGVPPSMVVLIEPPSGKDAAAPAAAAEPALSAGAVRGLLPSAADAAGAHVYAGEGASYAAGQVHAALARLGVRTLTGTLVAVRPGPQRRPPHGTDGVAADPSLLPPPPPLPELVAQFVLVTAAGTTTRRRRSLAAGSSSLGPDARQAVTRFTASLLLCADAREVDAGLAAAAGAAGVVYDGRVVVDRGCATNDAGVFCSGPAAKFSRRYLSALPLDAVDPGEAGRVLAEAVAAYVASGCGGAGGSGGGASGEPTPPPLQGLPEFQAPRVQRALLPGRLHFLRSALPLPCSTLKTAGAQTTTPSFTEIVSCVVGADGVPQRRWRLVLDDASGRLVAAEFVGTDGSLAGRLGDAGTLVGLHASYLGLERVVTAAALAAARAAPTAGGSVAPAGASADVGAGAVAGTVTVSLPGDLTDTLLADWTAALLLDAGAWRARGGGMRMGAAAAAGSASELEPLQRSSSMRMPTSATAAAGAARRHARDFARAHAALLPAYAAVVELSS